MQHWLTVAKIVYYGLEEIGVEAATTEQRKYAMLRKH